jgi:tripartite-type tricarboxylate transporter receptor subunit TctC
VKDRFLEQGAEPVSPGPEELEKFIASEAVKWRDIINKAGISPM